MESEIGKAAGAVWRHLEQKGPMTVAMLSKEIALNKVLMERAIGWLARERKVEFEKKGNSVTLRAK